MGRAASLTGMSSPTRIGVLGVQGDVREHVHALELLRVQTLVLRRPEELDAVEGLVIPGGESTTMDKLVRAFGLQAPLRDRIAAGMPVYGSCAGMIMLADRVTDATADQQTLGGMDITVRRNAFGRQVDSFEEEIVMPALRDPATPIPAVFIRAPWIDELGEGVEVLGEVSSGAAARAGGSKAVAARQGNLLVTSFHPEMTGDLRVHELFVGMVDAARSA